MRLVLGLHFVDVYIMAMLSLGHHISDIAGHLGFCLAWGSNHLKKIERVTRKKLFLRGSKYMTLTLEGLEFGKTCLKALIVLEPSYSEPKSKVTVTTN